MIRIVLLGRTGNHLFQYALGRVLAEKHGVPLVMDASWFNATGWAEVSHFLKLPLKAEVVRRCSIGIRGLRKLTGKHYWEYSRVPMLKESPNDQSFDAKFLDAPADCVLFGYFQSSRYFMSIADELRGELNTLIGDVFSKEPEDPVHQEIHQATSVAVHVRRGDYLRHPAFQVCDSAYYRTSMDEMRAHVESPRFFVFSDDPEWCRQEFREDDTVVIASGKAAANPLHDLRLMSLAGHHIIANSTYSWWAAWLGDKPGQQVIMPQHWYARDIIAPIDDKKWKIGGRTEERFDKKS